MSRHPQPQRGDRIPAQGKALGLQSTPHPRSEGTPLMPELRFPEFREQWITEPMGNLYSYIPTNSFSRDKLNYASGEIRNIHYGDIHTKLPALLDLRKTELPRINESESLSKFKERSFCKDGDVIFADASEDIDDVGKCIEIVSTNDLRILSGLHTIHARQTNSRFIVRFAGHLFHSNGIRTQVQRESQGAKVLGISANRLSAVNVTYPKDKAEQQKIADFLGSLDDLIAAHRRKLAALQDHKKGLLQQLFPAEGETTPKLRFPGFEEEWSLKKINDLEPFVTSGSRGWAAYYSDTGELFVRITNLSRSSIYLNLENSKYVKVPKASNEGVRTRLREHDILISITADIGIVGYIDTSVPLPAYINQHIALVRFDQSKASGKFVSYFLSSETAQKNFRGSTDSGTKSGMNLNGIKGIKLLLPCIIEQQKIADCLSALDACITAQTQHIAALKEHKKGLMQQLFPNPELSEA